ncbi:MAG: hypothetical protein ABL888_23260 [Pirellulaceae bacterium]
MGHQRLGEIPKSKKWSAVVTAVSGGKGSGGGTGNLAEEVVNIADLTLEAADSGLQRAVDDKGLRFTFFMLTQIVLAARHEDWRSQLAKLGITLTNESSLFELTAEVQNVIDDHLAVDGRPTDISEIAQQAAGEALAELAGTNAKTLFGSGSDELRDAIRKLSTRAGFAKLGQRFFGGFMTRFLNFYLCRVTAHQTGGSRISQVGSLTKFNESLAQHCQQSAQIVKDFCGEWYSKTEFQKGIDLENSSGFMAVALKKLQSELRRQRQE